MEGKYSDIELLYIREILDQHGEYLADALRDSIEKRKLRFSDDLLNSIDYKVTKELANPKLEVSFFSYGRALEIRWHKMRSNKRLLADAKADIWGGLKPKRARRKNTLWYSRTVYGSVNQLLFKLSTEFTEQEKERLKRILENEKIKIKV